MAARIRATDDAHYCYLNLFPNYAPGETLKTDSYREYVNRFDREVPLQLLSFDHYPVVGDTCRPEWYENLEIFSDEARKAGQAVLGLCARYGSQTLPDSRSGATETSGLQRFGLWRSGNSVLHLLDSGEESDMGFPSCTRRAEQRPSDRRIRQDQADECRDSGFERRVPRLRGGVGPVHTGESIPRGTVRLTELPAGVKKLETTGAGGCRVRIA